MTEKDDISKKIEEIKQSLFEPIKYTDFENRMLNLALVLFGVVLICAVVSQDFLAEYKSVFGPLFAFSAFIFPAIGLKAAHRTGKIRIRSAVVEKTKQPVFFWLAYGIYLLVGACALAVLVYFINSQTLNIR